MASFKYTQIPPFAKRDGDALLFNQEGSLEYYIPEDYYSDTKSSSASVVGAYVNIFGSFNYRIISKTGALGKLMEFNFPTIFTCRPNRTEKRKDIKLEEHLEEADYRVLIFEQGDQLITRCHVEQNIDNLSELFRLHIRTGRIPNTIPYNQLYAYLFECMKLNSGKYKIHSQAVGLLYSKLCRDPEDITQLFRMSKAINKKMTGYTPISIKDAAKYISPFASITSENFDQSVMSAVLLSHDEKVHKKPHKESPMERLIMM